MTTNQNDMRCTVCRQQKFQLRPRKSKLMESMQLYLCNDCFTNKREPRFAIIMVGRSKGIAAVEDYLRLHRYVGDEILAKDLI